MKKYGLIDGGYLGNDGAQAMMFILIQEIKMNYPELEPLVILPEADRKADRSNLNFRYIYKNEARVYDKKFLEQVECILDVSGYALGSQWGTKASLMYLRRIGAARKLGIPVYLFPQSFGPFEYPCFLERIKVKLYLYRYLRYPTVVCAREWQGYRSMRPYCSSNLLKTIDMVLGYKKELQWQYVYKSEKSNDEYEICENGVAVIPNMRNIVCGEGEAVLGLYSHTIKVLIDQGKKVYLITHSKEDKLICRKLKSIFEEESGVILLEKQPDCIQFSKLIAKFDFTVASRYHAIVNAYKKNVPCVVIGWAAKYKELLEQFRQERYLLDVRLTTDVKAVERIVMDMLNRYGKEKTVIEEEYGKCGDVMEDLKFGCSK